MTLRAAALVAAIAETASVVLDVITLASSMALYQREPALFLPWGVQVGTHAALALFLFGVYRESTRLASIAAGAA